MPVVVNIAGTNGSGKSHTVLDLFGAAPPESRRPVYEEGRKEPIGYELSVVGVARKIYVVGSYSNPTGGADTIKPTAKARDLVIEQFRKGNHVVYEGSYMMGQTSGPQLVQALSGRIFVLVLSTPLATCIASVNRRRAERGQPPLESTKDVESNYRRAIKYGARMKDAGANVFRVSRSEALPKLIDILTAGR